MATKPICRECLTSNWEEIVRNIDRNYPNFSLWQCKECKRVVVFDPCDYENGALGGDRI